MPDRPTSQDVLLALLALDSYSRGKNAQLLNKDGSQLATTIGSASWNFVSDTDFPTAPSTGFSASKYTLLDGTTVIAYRGTDFNFSGLGGLALDIGAWLSSFGVLGDSAGPVKLQPYYAQEFYKFVTGRSLFPDGGGSGTPGSNVIITGHSLGGSLAGYVASLSHDQAVIFNEIPYLGLALTKAINTYIDSIKGRPDFSTLVDQLVQLLNGQGISFPSFNLPTAGNITSFQTIGEIAQFARSLGPFAGFLAQFALGPLSAAVGTAAFAYGSATSEPTVKMNPYDGGLQGAVTLHSQALMVLLTYAASKSYEDWQAIGPQLLNALFSDDVANADNAAGLVGGYAGPAQRLMDAIAYSTVAPGPGSGTVFGDTGASALFNDANELGKVIKSGPSAFFRKIVSTRRQSWFSSALTYTDVKQEIASLVAQYAGALALNKVTSAGGLIPTANGPVDVRDGILSLSKRADGAPGVLSVDVSSVLWKDVLGTKVDPIGLADFRTAFFGQAPMTDGIVNRKFISWLLGNNKIDDEALKFLAKGGWGATTTDIFDRFDIAVSDQGGKIKIEERSYDPGPLRGNNAHVDVYIGSKKNENITGTRGDDLILGVSGTDRIDGGAGDDVIIAGIGSNSTTIGGVGRDVVINFSTGGVVYGDTIDGVDAHGNSTPTRVADTEANADIFWYAPGITIMDAQLHDRLVFQGTPLTGGSRNPAYFATAKSIPFFVGPFTPGAAASAVISEAAQLAGIYFDKLFPAITYKMDKNGTLKIGNIWDGLLRWVTGQGGIFSSGSGNGEDLRGVMAVRNFNLQHSPWGYQQAELAKKGTFGMSFKDDNPLTLLLSYAAALGGLLAMPEIIWMQTLLLFDEILAESSAIQSAAKIAKWIAGGDPLVIDLEGNGIETTTLDGSSVYFNLDGGKFTSRTGWLSGTDGFLVFDRNHNGTIDDISELFGNRTQGGYSVLSQSDDNHDGVIDAGDAIWSELQIWQDLNGDGVTQAGELKSMAEEGLVTLNLAHTALDVTTPQGTQLPSVGQVTFADGRTSHMFEAIFDTSSSDTRYAGETGLPGWQGNLQVDARGFGLLTDLSVAMSNDIGFGQLVASTVAAMTTPDMRVLLQQSGEVLGQWGEMLSGTEELTPVLLGTDAGGGYWTLQGYDFRRAGVNGFVRAKFASRSNPL